MKSVFRFNSILVVFLIVALGFVTEIHARNNASAFRSDLGISLDGNYSNADLTSFSI